jgi:hypothetical protein
MKGKGWLTAAFADTAPGIYPGSEAAGARHERRRHRRGVLGRLLTLTRTRLPWSPFSPRRWERPPR